MSRRVQFIVLSLILSLVGMSFVIRTGHAAAQSSDLIMLVDAPSTAPDLLIESITLTPLTPTPGGSVDIKIVIKNAGDVAAPGFRVHLYVEPTDNPPTQATQHTATTFFGLGLAPGAKLEWTRTGQTVSSSTPVIYVWIDRDNQIVESDEDNNLFPKPPSGNPDSFEEDDTCQVAKDVAVNAAPQNHNLLRSDNKDDEDWTKFQATSGVTYVARATPAGEDADLYIEVYGSCTVPGTLSAGAIITFTAPADGPIYLKIGSNKTGYGPKNDYLLDVGGETACSISQEPNNFCSLPVELAAGPVAQAHTFCAANDVDWMRVPVKAGATYKVTTTNIGTKADAQLSIFASCDDTGNTGGQELTFTATKGGFVYIKTENNDPGLFGPGTDYTVKVELDGPDGCEEDPLEQDDTSANAQPLNINNNPRMYNTCPAGDVDWVSFNAVEDETYTIETLNLATKADTKLCLHDAQGKALQCDDDGGAGKGSRITLENASAGTYLFSVKSFDPEVAGPDTAYGIQVVKGQCKLDSFEDNNTQQTAKSIQTDGTAQSHNICAKNDVDWVSFTGTSGTTYTIEANKSGPDADTTLELYDANATRLARNDDFSPNVDSRLIYQATGNATYFVKVQLFNPESYGAGTEYNLKVQTGIPTATPTPTVTPAPTATPIPTRSPSTGVRTLILVNRSRIASLYSEALATQLMNKLDQLAQHADVRGEIIRLDNNAEVSAAYAAWTADETSLTSVDKANAVADSIRRVIMTVVGQREGIEYLILVGDDRALPMRRVPDFTPKTSELNYANSVDSSNPVGAAIAKNYYFTDDFFGDKNPTPHQQRELYIPDLAVGRLIESPDDMTKVIDAFLANSATTVERAFVSGYDFVRDTGAQECATWKKAIGDASVNCLIEEENKPGWTREQFTGFQLRTASPIKFQSISGHAFHSGEGIAAGGWLSGAEIDAVAQDLSGGLIYTLACHGGLNVPPTNSTFPLDLPQVFARKGANYVGNTGYGWGVNSAIGLSEKMIILYSNEMLVNGLSMGKALAAAKTRYYATDSQFSAYDEKVMQQLVFYGLPMFTLHLQGTLGDPGEEFPGVGFDADPGTLGDDDIFTRGVSLNFTRVLDPDDPASLDTFDTGAGEYASLNGSISTDVGEAVQPLFFGDITSANAEARSILVLTTTFQTKDVQNPLVTTPVNELVPRSAEDETQLDPLAAWFPAMPSTVQSINGKSKIITQLGQYNPDSGEERLYSTLQAEVYYSTSADQVGPEITVVDGIYDSGNRTVWVKIGAVDSSGVKEVLVSYLEDSTLSTNTIKVARLTFDAGLQKWTGTFTGDGKSRFFVQAVDEAGNVISETNKGSYFAPALALEGSLAGNGCTGVCVYLPALTKQ